MHVRIAQLAARCEASGRLPESAASMWVEVAAALSPVIGERAVGALFKRSIYLVRIEYPWLQAVGEDNIGAEAFATLLKAFAAQSPSVAAGANAALLRAFHDVLARLIGESLTTRLLMTVWENPSSGPAAQESKS